LCRSPKKPLRKTVSGKKKAAHLTILPKKKQNCWSAELPSTTTTAYACDVIRKNQL